MKYHSHSRSISQQQQQPTTIYSMIRWLRCYPGRSLQHKMWRLLSIIPLLKLLLLSSSIISSSSSRWVSTNPGGGGALNSPILFPLSGSSGTTPNVYIVGSDLGGLYISFNQGKTYRAVGATSGILSTHVSSMVAFRVTSLGRWRLLVGTDNGIFVGTFLNDSTTVPVFTQVPSTAGGYIAAMAVASNRVNGNPNQVVYATMYATWDGTTPLILRSDDDGQSFSSLNHNLPSDLKLRMVGMRCHPVDPDGVWAISGEGRFAKSVAQAFFSKDGGVTWTRMDPGQGRVLDLAYSLNVNHLNELLLTTEGQSDETTPPPAAAIYRNDETGYGPWIDLSSNVGFGVSGVILADATNSQHIRTLDFRFNEVSQTYRWETYDGGQTWSNSVNVVKGGWAQSNQAWGFGTSFQGYLQTIGYDPYSPNYILWVGTQFVKQSSDGGQTWVDGVSNQVGSNAFQSRGLDNIVPIIIEPSRANASLIYAGHMDLGLWKSSDAGKSWQPLNQQLVRWNYGWGGLGGNTLTVLADPSRSNVVWAQVTGDLSDPLFLVKSIDGGNTWYESMTGLPTPASGIMIESLDIVRTSPVSNRRLFVVVGGDVYLSTNDGNNWSKVLTCNDCIGVRVAYSSSSAAVVVFAFGPSGVWKSIRNGVAGSFRALSLPSSMTTGWTAGLHWLNDPWQYTGPIDMAFRGIKEVWLAVLRSGGLYYSSDSGQNWRLVYTNPYVRTVAVDPVKKQVLVGSSSALNAGGYSTSSKGLLVHKNGTTSSGWTATNAGLVYPFATFVTVAPSGQRWLISPGQGVLKWT